MTDYKRETFKQKIIMLNLPIGFKSVILIDYLNKKFKIQISQFKFDLNI
jgi:hypothetical protein